MKAGREEEEPAQGVGTYKSLAVIAGSHCTGRCVFVVVCLFYFVF